jgi:hypothetical protein
LAGDATPTRGVVVTTGAAFCVMGKVNSGAGRLQAARSRLRAGSDARMVSGY